ncbi:hypothetical protein D3C81_1947200 [compost metagenome]
MSAQVIHFPNPVADTLEHFARLARAGVITGAVIAAKTALEPLITDIGVNDREVAALITELQDARMLALLGEEDV